MASAPTTPACAKTTEVRPVISGSYTGGDFDTFGVVLAFEGAIGPERPGLDMLSPSIDRRLRVGLAAPYFASAFSATDLCSGEKAPPGEVAITCLGENAELEPIVARVEGRTVVVHVDGEATRLELRDPEACPKLVSDLPHRDLEPLRRAFANDAPSARCRAAKAGKSQVRARFHLDVAKSAAGFFSAGSQCATRATISLRVDRAAKLSLGDFENRCGMCRLTRYGDANAATYGCSDMDLSQRFAYQLGDAVYVTTGEQRVERIELPCGARASFGMTGPPPEEEILELFH